MRGGREELIAGEGTDGVGERGAGRLTDPGATCLPGTKAMRRPGRVGHYHGPMSVSPEDYLPFSHVCRGLPGLRPRITQASMRALHEEAVAAGFAHVGGLLVSHAQLRELFVPVTRDGFEGLAVSPAGAQLLARLYEAGVLDTAGRPPALPAPELLAYVRGEGPWLEPARARAQARANYLAKIAKPATIQEHEFTPRLLDDVFRLHRGRGEGSLEIGGLRVTRRPSKQVLEGRTMVFTLRFEWIAEGGELRALSVFSAHAGIWSRDQAGA